MADSRGLRRSRRTLSPAYIEAVRSRIRAGGIVNRLEKHVLGQIELSATQVQAALGLLRKVVPDQQAIEHSGEVEHRYAARVPEAIDTAEKWQQQHAPTIQ